MKDIATEFSARRRFLPYGYSAEYSLTAAIDAEGLAQLIELSLKRLIPGELLQQDCIENLKGRDTHIHLDGTAAKNVSDKNEFFYIAGTRPSTDPDEAAEEEFILEPFEIGLFSKFEDFPAAKSIRYRLDLKDPQGLLQDNQLGELSLVEGICFKQFRIGLEFFESRLFSYAMGTGPVVTETFYLESKAGQLSFRIAAEGLKQRQALPLLKGGFLYHLREVLAELSSFDLVKDYLLKSAS